MFRNLRFYRVTSPWPQSEQELSDVLLARAFMPCGAFSERSAGWEAPVLLDDAPLCRRLHGADLLQLRTQSRVLPIAAIKEALEDRVAEYRARTAQEPNRGELRRLQEQTRDELLPKALVKSERTRACFIHAESLLVIDAATAGKAEWLMDHLRACFSQFHCKPLTFNGPVGELMRRIVLGETLRSLSVGRECRMQALMDSKSIVSWKDIELSDPSIRQHLDADMKLTHLGLEFDHILSCVIDEDAVLSKFRFITGENADTIDDEDPLARQDADFVLFTGTVSRLIEDLKKLLGGYAASVNKP